MELFTPLKIRNIEIKNRIAKSAMHETMATPEGEVTDQVVRFNQRVAKGGTGLIIAGNYFVNWAGHNWPRQIGLHSDEMIEGNKKLTDAVHEEGAAIFAQLNDCGRESIDTYTNGIEPRGPSAVIETMFWHTPREMTKQDIDESIESFALAGARAKAAGYDGIQLHGAHGYLVNQFLSPHTNRRKDEYGGSLENRWRFVKELYEAVRAEVGDFPIIIK